MTEHTWKVFYRATVDDHVAEEAVFDDWQKAQVFAAEQYSWVIEHHAMVRQGQSDTWLD